MITNIKDRLHRFRRKTRVIKVGNVKIGGDNPVSIQSMLKLKTSDVKNAVRQIREIEHAGCEIIRVAVKDYDDARAIRELKKGMKIPVVADIHFDYKLALESIKNGADKIRINPGNINKPDELKAIIRAAKERKIPIRIGINSGSIPREIQNSKLVNFALKYIKLFERQNFHDIIVSLKSSDVFETVSAYRGLARICNYPFHLGVTAAGPYDTSIIKSSIGIGTLLLDGIGDTIRVSLTGDPKDEVILAKRILQSLKIRNFGSDIISCPACGRIQVDLVKIVNDLRNKLATNYYLRATKHPLTIAVMGCEVNGPGEAKEADIGIAFGKDSGVIFKNGKIVKKVNAKEAVRELIRLI